MYKIDILILKYSQIFLSLVAGLLFKLFNIVTSATIINTKIICKTMLLFVNCSNNGRSLATIVSVTKVKKVSNGLLIRLYACSFEFVNLLILLQ